MLQSIREITREGGNPGFSFSIVAFLLIFFTSSPNSVIKPIKVNAALDKNVFSFDITSTFEKKAFDAYPQLSLIPYFDTTLLKDIPRLCEALKKEAGFESIIQLGENTTIHYTLYDRGSDSLMVIGPGFPTPLQKMAPFIYLFPRYNVLLFDYPGQSLKHSLPWSCNPFQWLGALTYKLFGIDMHKSSFGTQESEVVKAVVKVVLQQKKYNHVYGLGLCYSSYVFARAAAEDPRLFDKLILDSSWPTLKRVIKTIAQFPFLLFSRHSSPLPLLTNRDFFQQTVCFGLECYKNFDLDILNPLDHYLKQLKIPILFFQGEVDYFCTMEEFNNMLRSIQGDYLALITQNNHGKNHIWQKELYAYVCNQFLDHDMKACIDWLHSF